ncbi:MAG: hypothetical protein ACJ746_31305 [Bryobacteraceae bacterium]
MTIPKALSKLLLSAFAALLGAANMTAAPPVVMKILVLAGNTNEASYQSITSFLNQIGVPYQGVALRNVTPDAAGNRMSKVSLTDTALGRGLYQGIIVTDSTFAACTPSCMSAADWTTLNSYASQYSVRVASYYTSPQAQWGLVPADGGTNYSSSNPLNVKLTAAGASVFSYLNAVNSIPVNGQGTSTVRAYLATTTAAANETTTPLITTGIYTVAATHTTADGRETLALTMDNGPTLLHSVAFSYGVINWVTKGVFLGSRRVYLNPQIDDMLLGNRVYAPTLPQCPDDDSCPTVFATSQDIQSLVTWQNNLKADPLFSTFHATYALNGVGTTWFPSSDPVFAAIRSLGSNFTWLSHTWDHANLDCYSVNTSGACVPANLSQSSAELNKNITVAPSLGINLDRTSMVTPFNGGLGNPNFLNAAVQSGIQYIVTATLPQAISTGNVNPVNPNIYEIPRVKSIFDDVSVPQTGAYGSYTDEYNATYGPRGTQPKYSQNQTYAQIVDNDSNNLLINNILAYEPYLLAFHIDNASVYDGTHSMFTDLMDAIVAKYRKLFTLPVLTVEMKDLGAVLKARASLNASGVVGVYTPGVSVALTATRAAIVPVTGICSQATCGTYGGQIQDNVVMAANSTVTLPLTPVEGVALSSFSVSPASLTGGTVATGTVNLTGGAPSAGVSVTLSSNNGSAVVPGSVTIPMGSTSASFTITTSSVSSSISATITASYAGLSKTADLRVAPSSSVALVSVSVSPSAVSGGSSSIGTVTLTGSAPSGGVAVTLSTNTSSATVPASVTVAAGASTANFSISTSTVNSTASATITASYGGLSKTAALSVTPVLSTAILSSVSLAPTSVIGGASLTGTVSLAGPAPTGGSVVALASNNTLATTPASIIVPAGSTSATFTVSTSPIGSTRTVTVTGSYNGVSKTATVTITPSATVALVSVSVNPASIRSETPTNGTVTISTAAPAGGIGVELWTTGTVAFVPIGVTIPAGSTTATFNVSTNYTTTTLQDTVTAFYNGVSKTAAVTVTP